MSKYQEITEAIKRSYYKRIDKDIPEDLMNKWLDNLKEFWKKNKDIIDFIEELQYNSIRHINLSTTQIIPYSIALVNEYTDRRKIYGEEETLKYFLFKYRLSKIDINKFIRLKEILEYDT